jgi:hypothetical protein
MSTRGRRIDFIVITRIPLRRRHEDGLAVRDAAFVVKREHGIQALEEFDEMFVPSCLVPFIPVLDATRSFGVKPPVRWIELAVRFKDQIRLTSEVLRQRFLDYVFKRVSEHLMLLGAVDKSDRHAQHPCLNQNARPQNVEADKRTFETLSAFGLTDRPCALKSLAKIIGKTEEHAFLVLDDGTSFIHVMNDFLENTEVLRGGLRDS